MKAIHMLIVSLTFASCGHETVSAEEPKPFEIIDSASPLPIKGSKYDASVYIHKREEATSNKKAAPLYIDKENFSRDGFIYNSLTADLDVENDLFIGFYLPNDFPAKKPGELHLFEPTNSGEKEYYQLYDTFVLVEKSEANNTVHIRYFFPPKEHYNNWFTKFYANYPDVENNFWYASWKESEEEIKNTLVVGGFIALSSDPNGGIFVKNNEPGPSDIGCLRSFIILPGQNEPVCRTLTIKLDKELLRRSE